MLKRSSLSAILVAGLAVAASAPAPHGGKVDWVQPKNMKDFEAIVEANNQAGKPMLAYFTMDGCGYCVKLDEGAFSDEKVVKASEKISRVMLVAGRADAVAKKFGITGYPALFFLKPDGSKAAEGSRDADALIAQIDDTLVKFTRAPKWAESEESAIATAKEESKPLVVVYRDGKAKSDAAMAEFGALPVAAFYDKAVWVQKTIDVKSDEAKALGITSVPAMWVVDARIDDAKAGVLKKIALPKGAAGLKTELAAVLKSWKKDVSTK